jgi:hypothetical protein
VCGYCGGGIFLSYLFFVNYDVVLFPHSIGPMAFDFA